MCTVKAYALEHAIINIAAITPLMMLKVRKTMQVYISTFLDRQYMICNDLRDV
jgi:hypothetical protein